MYIFSFDFNIFRESYDMMILENIKCNFCAQMKKHHVHLSCTNEINYALCLALNTNNKKDIWFFRKSRVVSVSGGEDPICG